MDFFSLAFIMSYLWKAFRYAAIAAQVVSRFHTATNDTQNQPQGVENKFNFFTVVRVFTNLKKLVPLVTRFVNYIHGKQQNQQEAENDGDGISPQVSSQPNLDFYRNKIPFQPNGESIENILETWQDQLKTRTDYIQWLFPNREAGVNPHAFALRTEEAEVMRSDPVMRDRVRRAFLMILDLYGMTLDENKEFQIKDNNERNLEYFISHRVSAMWVCRILKALKELGHKDLMLPWLKFLAVLIYQRNILPPKFRKSFTEYWLKTLDYADQASLEVFYRSFSENAN